MNLSLGALKNRAGMPIAIAIGFVVLSASSAVAGSLITSAQIKDDTIRSRDVKGGTLQGSDVKNNTLGPADLANQSLTTQDVKDSSLTSDDLLDGSVKASDLEAGAIPQYQPPTYKAKLASAIVEPHTMKTLHIDCDFADGEVATGGGGYALTYLKGELEYSAPHMGAGAYTGKPIGWTVKVHNIADAGNVVMSARVICTKG